MSSENKVIDTQSQIKVEFGINGTSDFHGGQSRNYDPAWWHLEMLRAFEDHISPPTQPAPPKKPRTGWTPTFATPTESFNQKVVNPEKFQRSMSGTFRLIKDLPVDPSSFDINWMLATHELSKLIIPSDRATTSCKAEDLAVVKPKKQRQSAGDALPITDSALAGRQLRGRKAKVADHSGSTSDAETASIMSDLSKADRRRTIGDVPLAEQAPKEPVARRRSSRRSSIAPDFEPASQSTESVPPVPPIPSLPPPTQKTKATPRSPRSKKTKAPPPLPSVAAHTIPPPSFAAPPAVLVQGKAQTDIATGNMEGNGTALQDMDQLTSAVKRITLKVGSREEHDRKQKEREQAESKARAEKKPRKLGIPKPKAVAGESTNKPGQGINHKAAATPIATQQSLPAQAGLSAKPANGLVAEVHNDARPPPAIASDPSAFANEERSRDNNGHTDGQPSTAPLVPTSLSTPGNDIRPMAVQSILSPTIRSPKKGVRKQQSFQKSTNASSEEFGTPAAPSMAYQESAVPDTAARQLHSEHQAANFRSYPDMQQSQQTRLPVFSSTGAIPFGMPPPNKVPSMSSQHGASTVQDSWTGNGVSRSMLSSEEGATREQDIWDVPDTPAKR